MSLTPEQVTAMAKEIVQHVKGEEKRAEEERQAKAKGGEEAKREARLVEEVAAKLKMALADAVEPDNSEGAGSESASGGGSQRSTGATGSAGQPKR